MAPLISRARRVRVVKWALLGGLVLANLIAWTVPFRRRERVDTNRLVAARLTYPTVTLNRGDGENAWRLVDAETGTDGVRVAAGTAVQLDFKFPRRLARILACACPGTTLPPLTARIGSTELGGHGPTWRTDTKPVRNVTLWPSADTCVSEIMPIFADVPVGVLSGPPSEPGLGPYFAELLWAEGFPSIQLLPPGAVEPDVLALHQVVIVPVMALADETVQTLVDFARGGGILVFFGEDGALARAVGPGEQLYHDAKSLLERYRRIDKGLALGFSEDLPTFLLRFRQGGPEAAGHDTDGVMGLTPNDLLVDGDVRRRAIPGADLLLRTFADRVQAWAPFPLLRVAPLPEDAPLVIVLTSDQDFADEAMLASMAEFVAAWDGEITFYLTSGTRQSMEAAPGDVADTDPSRAWADRTHGQGVELSVHPNASGLAVSRETHERIIAEHVRRFRARYGREARTARMHRLGWVGYVDTARVLERHGVVMDLDFLPLATVARPALGYGSGSATPVRFADEHGHLRNVLLQPTHLDDHVLFWESGRYQRMDVSGLRAVTLDLLQQAKQRRAGPVVINHHPLWFAKDHTWLRAVVEWAEREKVPLWSAERWLDFTLARRSVRAWTVGAEWEIRGGDEKPMDLLVTRRVGARSHAGTWCDGTWISVRETWRLGDQELRRVRLPAGGCRVRLVYE